MKGWIELGGAYFQISSIVGVYYKETKRITAIIVPGDEYYVHDLSVEEVMKRIENAE